MSQYNEIADQLWQATVSGKTTDSIALANPDLGLDGAYAVQALMVAKREAAGAVRTGRKLGVTAAGGMKMFGISEPVHGVLFGTGAVPNGGAVAIGGQMLQPCRKPKWALSWARISTLFQHLSMPWLRRLKRRFLVMKSPAAASTAGPRGSKI